MTKKGLKSPSYGGGGSARYVFVDTFMRTKFGFFFFALVLLCSSMFIVLLWCL